MIAIDNTLISEELFDVHFACDLKSCKGICCVEGESGAPLEESELQILEDIYPEVEPFMRQEGKEAIQELGFFEVDEDGDYVTPLVNGAECAYVTFTEDGIALCAIEQAYRAGKVSWQKPISCHLYPIRIKALKDFDAINYHKWHICEPACSCGAALQIPVYRFCKDSLVRKYGQAWYDTLDEAYRMWKEQEI